MGDVVRFPQERCRWPEDASWRDTSESAVIIILPVVRIERSKFDEVSMACIPDYVSADPIVSDDTERRVQAFFDELRNL